MFFNSVFGIFSNDMAIDLGTANTLVYVRGRGVILSEPSVVAVKTDLKRGSRIVAVGTDAKKMLGRTPDNIKAIRPMKDGVIADFEVTEAMLKHFIFKIHRRRFLVKPRIVICIPSGVTQVEMRAVQEAAESAGAREVYLVEEPIAAAIGAHLPITEPTSSMIVDIGGGTTEVAVISMSDIVYSKSLRVAGDKIDTAIIRYVKQKYSLLIGERTAEMIKMMIGSACHEEEESLIEVKGRDLIAGIPKVIALRSGEVTEAIAEPVRAILETVKTALEQAPPELAADIVDNGIVLTGGGSLLKNLDEVIRRETSLPVVVAEDPLSTVVLGSGLVFEHFDILKDVLVKC
ncbi:MAG: rod shape-determining protein [Desulfomonilaceae bacterium]|jgi:rod shape-determining protein MreB and related proteins|nr:rod shape-determining protein [Desulfomonilaceae bacterium]